MSCMCTIVDYCNEFHGCSNKHIEFVCQTAVQPIASRRMVLTCTAARLSKLLILLNEKCKLKYCKVSFANKYCCSNIFKSFSKHRFEIITGNKVQYNC